MKGNLSKKKGLLSEMTNDHLDYISDKLYGKVGFTREDFEKLKEETAQEYNDLAEVVVSKEDVANKSTTIDDNADDVKYPTTKAVKVYADKSKEQAVIEASELIMKEVSDNHYNKVEVDNKLSSVYKFCGSVDDFYDLPSVKSQLNIGDTYNILSGRSVFGNQFIKVDWTLSVSAENDKYYIRVYENDIDITESIPPNTIELLVGTGILNTLVEEKGWELDYFPIDFTSAENYSIYFAKEIKEGDNLSWTGWTWDVLGGTIDLSNYYTKQETQMLIDTQDHATTLWVNNEIRILKEDADATYATKEDVGNIGDAITEIIALQNSYIGGDAS